MAQHGYLGEGYGLHGDRDPDYERDRDEDRERVWRERGEDRGFMLEGRDRDRLRERDDDSGEWFGGREQQRTRGYGAEHGYGGFQGDYSGGREQGGFGAAGDWREGRRSFSSHPDDHYRSWRQKQIDALDRDYAEYCREREQKFHQEFDSWRRNRQGTGQQQQQGRSPESVMELNNPATTSGEGQGATTPMAEATLGTNNPENSATPTGRGRR